MTDKTVLITGANSGIGKSTAKALAGMGARVVMVSRNLEKGESARQEVMAASGNPLVDLMICDLGSLASIRRFASEFLVKYDRLDVLINNAGIYTHSRLETADGFEYQIGVNHLGHFLLTNLLLDLLEKSGPSRIINVSSAAHMIGKIDFDDLHLSRSYSSWKSYSQSKLANILFTYELAHRVNGNGLTVNALHPGFISSRFAVDRASEKPHPLIKLGSFIAKTPEKGAETSVYLASSPEVEGVSGKYFVNRKQKASSRASYDLTVAARLWEVSEELTQP